VTARWEAQQWKILVAALSGVFISLFPLLMVIAALPTIAEDLGTSEATLAWAITAPLLASAVLLPTAGRLGDLYGHRRVFVIGLAISGTFGGLSALAWNPLSLIVFRTISQSAGTATSPAAIALVITAFSTADRPRVLGFWAFSTAFAPALGLLAGGPAVDAFSWRGLFVLQFAVVALVLPFAVVTLRESVRSARVSFDVAGGAAFMAASGTLVFALDRAGHWRWGHPAVVVAFLLVPVALRLFLAAERRAADPILPLELLRHRDFVSSCSCELLIQVATNGSLFLMPLVFHDHYGAGISRIALYLAPMPVGMALVAPYGGRLAQRIGERSCAVLGTALLTASFLAVVAGDEADGIAILLVSWFAVGLANGLIRPAIASAAAAALDPAYYGAGMATTRMVSTVGAAAGITLMVSLLPNGGARLALLVCAGSCALATIAAANLRAWTPLPDGEGIEIALAVQQP
jgi:MFS family permease